MTDWMSVFSLREGKACCLLLYNVLIVSSSSRSADAPRGSRPADCSSDRDRLKNLFWFKGIFGQLMYVLRAFSILQGVGNSQKLCVSCVR